MTRWQYFIIDLSHCPAKQTEADRLNMLGSQGWELIAVLAPHRAVFKRPSVRSSNNDAASTDAKRKNADQAHVVAKGRAREHQ